MRAHFLACVFLAAQFVQAPPCLIAQAVHPGKVVRVTAPSVVIGRLEGVFLGRQGDTLFFGNDERGPIAVPLSAITALDISVGKSRWRGARRGALWGGAITLGLGAVAITDSAWDTAADGPKGTFLAESVAGGALIGGIVGLFVPSRVWCAANPRDLLTGSSVTTAYSGTVDAVPAPAPKATPSIRKGATPAMEATLGVTAPAPYADFPTPVASIAVNLTRRPFYGAALVGDFDASFLRLGLMAGPRIYIRSGPLYERRATLTYFGQVLAGTVVGGESGLVRSSGGFAFQPGAGVDIGGGSTAIRAQIDYRIVPNGFVDDDRVPGRHVDDLSGLRVVIGATLRIPP